MASLDELRTIFEPNESGYQVIAQRNNGEDRQVTSNIASDNETVKWRKLPFAPCSY